jgi:hypothetical protein
MKRINVIALCLACIALSGKAQTASSLMDGLWTNPIIWDCTCVPLPGYEITINHEVTMNTNFAYTSGFIQINASGGLIQDAPDKNLWVYGTGHLTNYGNLVIRNILYEGSTAPLQNFGFITANLVHLTNGLENMGYGFVEADSLYNNDTLINEGFIQVIAITNAGYLENKGTINFTDYTNNGVLVNSGGHLSGLNNMWNQGEIINSPSFSISVGNNFLNNNLLTFGAVIDNDGFIYIGNSLYNFDTIRGASGYVEVADTSYNSGTMTGTFDFCDLTPPGSAPFVDINLGSIGPGITWCQQQDISEAEVPEIIVFPNPASDFLYFSLNSADPFHVTIINNSGKVVHQATGMMPDSAIDVSGLPGGVYFLMLQQANTRHSETFHVIR